MGSDLKDVKSNGDGSPVTNDDSAVTSSVTTGSPVTNGDPSAVNSSVTTGLPVTTGSPVPAAGSSSPVATTAPRPSVDPHSLAHRPKLSKTARALLGAEILDGNIPLMNFTREIVAKAVGVSAGYIDKARQLSPEQRWKVARGERSLVER